jgi:putative phage-type endonuclease
VKEKDAERRKWLDDRRQFIGSSDIAKLLGLTPKAWGGAYSVWKSKMFEASEDEANVPAWLEWGRRLEPIIAEEYGNVSGMVVDLFADHYKTPWLADGFDHVACTPDYFASDPASASDLRHPSERTIVECKNVGAFHERDWGPTGTDAETNCPERYVAQVRWQMGCTGAQAAVICALIGGSDWRHYKVDPDPEWFQRYAEFAEDWYKEHVTGDVAPIPDERNEILLGAPPEVGNVMVADDDIETLINRRAACHKLVSDHTKLRQQLDAQLVVAMGDTYDGIRLRGEAQPAVTHKAMPSNPDKRRYSFRKKYEQE